MELLLSYSEGKSLKEPTSFPGTENFLKLFLQVSNTLTGSLAVLKAVALIELSCFRLLTSSEVRLDRSYAGPYQFARTSRMLIRVHVHAAQQTQTDLHEPSAENLLTGMAQWDMEQRHS